LAQEGFYTQESEDRSQETEEKQESGVSKSRIQEPEFRIQKIRLRTTVTDFLFFWLLDSEF
jgi:hypothetical protein